MDPNGTEVYIAARIKMMHIMKSADGMPFLCSCQGLSGYMERYTELTLIDAGMPDMVTMIMGNDDSVNIADRTSPRSQLLFDLDAVYPCIKEEPQSTRFYINTVTVAAGLQRKCEHDDRVLSIRL